MSSVWTELRRRNVVKVAVAYAIVGWLLAQLAEFAADTFGAPDWVLQMFVVFLILGFPLALILAWAYELTPDGLKSAAEVEPTESITHITGHRLNYAILGLVVVAVGFLIADQYVFEQQTRANIVTQLPAPADVDAEASAPNVLQRFEFEVGETTPLAPAPMMHLELAVSPDGTRIAYVANVDGRGIQLYTRAIDRFDADVITEPDINARKPFFSRDGEWLGFDTELGSILRKVSVRGGPPQNLNADIQRTYGASWSPDDTIVLSTTEDGGNLMTGFLARVPGAGGELERLTTPESGTAHLFPDVLPNGADVLFTIRDLGGAANDGSVAILSLDTLEYRTLIEGAFNARYVPTGHVVFIREDALWAVAFDVEGLRTVGTAVPVEEGIEVNRIRGDASYALSDNGMLVYARGSDRSVIESRARNLVWVDREGRQELSARERTYASPEYSPDGQRLAVSIVNDENQDIYVLDLLRGTSSRLTTDPADDDRPIWTPDGEFIVFASDRDDAGLFAKAANGTGEVVRVHDGASGHLPDTFLPDGSQLITRAFARGGGLLYLVSPNTQSPPQRLVPGPRDQNVASVSPDGRWLAYSSSRTGQNEVYVRPFPNVDDDQFTVSTNGGEEPLWGPDGSELFYLRLSERGDTEVWVTSVTSEPAFSAGEPELLFADDFVFGLQRPVWDISPDGERFVFMKQSPTNTSSTSIAVVGGFFDQLMRVAPRNE